MFSQFSNSALRFRNVGGKWVNLRLEGEILVSPKDTNNYSLIC